MTHRTLAQSTEVSGCGIISLDTSEEFRVRCCFLIRYVLFSYGNHRNFGYSMIFLHTPRTLRVWFYFLTEPTEVFGYGITCSTRTRTRTRMRSTRVYPHPGYFFVSVQGAQKFAQTHPTQFMLLLVVRADVLAIGHLCVCPTIFFGGR